VRNQEHRNFFRWLRQSVLSHRNKSAVIGVIILSGILFPGNTLSAPETSKLFCVNELTRSVIALNGVDPPYASRVYALSTILQHDLLLTINQGPDRFDPSHSLFFEAATSGLRKLIASEVGSGAVQVERLNWHDCTGTDDALRVRAATLADSILEQIMKRREYDGSKNRLALKPPNGAKYWQSFQNRPPVRSSWGETHPMVIHEIKKYAAPPPPEVFSSEFYEQLNAVENAVSSADLSVQKWADPVGTDTPAGHWLKIAEAAVANVESDQEKLFIVAATAMAMHDASIACWRTKFTYWYPRPSQVLPRLRPVISVPNFPAYTSGHATFSGAAAAVLVYFLPNAAPSLYGLAQEASHSRVVAGIHYPVDTAEGLKQGILIGQEVAGHLRRDQALYLQIAP